MTLLDLYGPEGVKPSNVVYWRGQSGVEYEFYNHPIFTAFSNWPGVYVFSRLHNGLLHSVYVGETHDFGTRVADKLFEHHAWGRIKRLGATHVSVRNVPGGKAERLRVELDLIHGLNPPANRQ